MSSKNKAFFDTNIWVYQFDRTAPAKQKRAEELVEQYIIAEQAVISTQVVQEFMNVALKKFDAQIPADELELIAREILKPLCQHVPSFDFYERTLRLYRSESINFYDALIVQAALDLECKTLYSEDLQSDRSYGILTVKNPFKT